MEKDKVKKKTDNKLIKPIVYALSVLIVIGSIIYGMISLSSIFSSGFSVDVFIFPLLMIKRLLPTTFFIIIITILLIIYGKNKPKFWYAIPIGIALIGIYWFIINITVYKAYVERFIK